jgi:hypothetical protein
MLCWICIYICFLDGYPDAYDVLKIRVKFIYKTIFNYRHYVLTIYPLYVQEMFKFLTTIRTVRLSSIIDPRAKQCTGTTTYSTIHRNKTVNVNKIKHTFDLSDTCSMLSLQNANLGYSFKHAKIKTIKKSKLQGTFNIKLITVTKIQNL